MNAGRMAANHLPGSLFMNRASADVGIGLITQVAAIYSHRRKLVNDLWKSVRVPIVLAGALICLSAGLRVVVAKDRVAPTRDPKELGRVAILPFLDISGERQEAKGEYRETALSEVEERFRKYEIAHVSRQEMEAALTVLKLVPTDEEDRTKAKLQTLADHLKVRYVVTGTIHDASSGRKRRGVWGEKKAGQAKVQFRVFDATTERYVEEWELTAASVARGTLETQRANKLRVKAVRGATQKSMAAFLAPFPKVHEDDPAES
jgi:hypothetical protein